MRVEKAEGIRCLLCGSFVPFPDYIGEKYEGHVRCDSCRPFTLLLIKKNGGNVDIELDYRFTQTPLAIEDYINSI